MTPIFAIPSQTAQSHSALTGVKDPSKVHAAKAKVRDIKTKEADNPAKSDKDEYLPEEKHEPSGRYWIEKGENGQAKIHFDTPDKDSKTGSPDKNPKTDALDKNPKTDTPDKASQKPEPEICKGNNDKAVREIEQLKEKKKTLEQQIQAETDEVKAKKLEQKLAQVENELRQKDNNSYLRRNTVFT